MDKQIDEVLEAIVRIPHDFSKGNTSEYLLLQESGYFKFYKQIHAEDIKEILKKHPHLIDEWLRWSDDNRSSTKWYFTKGEDGKCFVGYWPDGKEFEEINTSDEFYACSIFIKNKIESTRILFKK